MMTDEHETFEKLCRFCGLQKNDGKFIFSTEAMKNGLLTKIKELFPKEVELINSDTILPRFICEPCETTLNYFQEFRSRVKLVQENLQKKVEDDVAKKNDESHDSKSQHVCSIPRKADFLSVHLDPHGLISCLNCDAKLQRSEIVTIAESKPPICICVECGFKDEVEMFVLEDDLSCPKCTYMEEKKSAPVKQEAALKIFECDVCSKSFRSRGHLNRHRSTHFGSKPFACDKCGARFSQKSSLKTHSLIHDRANPFSCKWCGQQFRHKQTLANYVVSIHGVASESNNVYECDKCKKRFVQKEKLKRHYRSHSGEKPFKCDLCERTFSQKVNLKTHYKKHETEIQFANLCQTEMLSDGSVDNQLAAQQPTVVNSLVDDENGDDEDDEFIDLTHDVLVEATKRSESTFANLSPAALGIRITEENYAEMQNSVLNEAEKGKLIQELLSFENMSPENDSLETFSMVSSEYPNEDGALKVSSDSNAIYFNAATSNYIMYSGNAALYNLSNVSQCSTLPTFTSLNPVP